MSSQNGDFFVQFRVFYNKEFTRQKKVTNKLLDDNSPTIDISVLIIQSHHQHFVFLTYSIYPMLIYILV